MWWCSRRRALVGLGALPLAAACGFQPIYAPGGAAADMIGRIAIEPPESEIDFHMRERLTERLGVADAGAPYRLAFDVEVIEEPAGITQEDFITRYSVLGAADFRLMPAGSTRPLAADRVRAVTGYSAPASLDTSVYAVEAAEADAVRRLGRALADAIVLQLALSAEDWAA
jgi:LPS-assembly lipoprotein